ncbi:MAG: tetratricopeptide repeat protein [Brumimicrobium sp.]|nr:tetratricopeptide repeat protein [Brumimicrobium sp.]
MKKHILFFIFLFGLSPLFSQDQADSLFKELNKWQKKSGVAADTNLYNIYYQLGITFQYSNPDTAIYYFDKSIVYAKKQKDELKEAKSIQDQGWCLFLKGDYPKAIQYYNQVLTIIDKVDDKSIKEDKVKRIRAGTIGNLGVVYDYQGDYSKALDNYFKGIALYEEVGNIRGQAAISINLGIVYDRLGEYSKALSYYFKALKINEEIGNKNSQASNLMNIGITYKNQGDFPKALDFYFKALKIGEEIGDKWNQASNYGNIGGVYVDQGDYSKALDYFFKALKINEEIGNKNNQAINLGNIGRVYFDQEDYSKSLDYHFKALKINEEIGSKYGQALDLMSIGSVYYHQKYFSQAFDYFVKALEINEEIGDKQGQASALSNIGNFYFVQDDYTKSLDYYFKGLKIFEEIGDKQYQAVNLGYIGKVYIKQKKYKEADQYIQQAIEIGEELGIINSLKDLYDSQSELYFNTGNYKGALESYQKHIMYRDSVFSEENQKAAVQKEMQFEFDKKEALQQAEQEKKDAIAKEELAKQRLQRNGFIGGFILMLALTGVVYRNYRNKKKANEIISQQKKEVEQQKDKVEKAHDELAEKNREILDSITYAKRIQSAILPPTKLVKEYLPTSFILYKPKDIVAGDFYWMEQKGDLLLFAAADCTGHGVPGAMVSVVCNHALNRSVREYNLSEPGKILDKTRELVIEEFEKSEEGVKDGMDISLCGLNLKTNTLTWSGANNPLWVIKKGDTEVEEIKANKQPIGKYVAPEPFDTHTIQLEKGDSLYIFTDGYQDQFGGEKGKKFKAKNMRELVLSIQNQPMDHQREAIDTAFEEWKQNHEQVDDVCVIGVRV